MNYTVVNVVETYQQTPFTAWFMHSSPRALLEPLVITVRGRGQVQSL